MENKQYFITELQLELLTNLKKKVDNSTYHLWELCKTEKADISYGFKLGEVYSNLDRVSKKLKELQEEIIKLNE